MTVIPYLDKRDGRHHEQLADLFMMSDFLLLPTRNEYSGILFCVASAFGLPTITANAGGISGQLSMAKNSFMLPISDRGSDYAKLIREIYEENQRYYELARSSGKAFDERHSWYARANMKRKLITEML
jgi:glycosyltransferase involved in cell wall biosynthesis